MDSTRTWWWVSTCPFLHFTLCLNGTDRWYPFKPGVGKLRPVGCMWPTRVYYAASRHVHTQPFYSPFSGTTWVSRYQKGKTNLDFTEARDSEWQWHQLGHMQICTSIQTDNHISTPPLKFFTGRMPFLPPNQQCQSTESIRHVHVRKIFEVLFWVFDLNLRTLNQFLRLQDRLLPLNNR